MPFRHDFDPTGLRKYVIRGIVGKTMKNTKAGLVPVSWQVFQ